MRLGRTAQRSRDDASRGAVVAQRLRVREAIGHQCMTYGISLWLPFHGTGTVATRNAPYYGSGVTPVEPYAFWSNVTPAWAAASTCASHSITPPCAACVGQWRRIAPNFSGDFYPLTPWSRDDTTWMAWQFHQPIGTRPRAGLPAPQQPLRVGSLPPPRPESRDTLS